MRVYVPDLHVKRGSIPTTGHRGAASITPEYKWRSMGAEHRLRMERLLGIGTKEAITNCRKLRFYPAGDAIDSLVFMARLHYLAGLLDVRIGDRTPLKQMMAQLQDSAIEAGYCIVTIDPKTHLEIPQ